MCRFLVDNGADVDEIAGRTDQAESLPLLAATTRATTAARGTAEFDSAVTEKQNKLRWGANAQLNVVVMMNRQVSIDGLVR